MRGVRGAWLVLIWSVLALVAIVRAEGATGVVVGSSPLAATRAGLDHADAHGWVVVEGETSLLRNTRSWIIVHVPPRRASHKDGEIRGGIDGGVRQILPAMQERPMALAAWGDELVVISEPDTIFPQSQRQVGSVRVAPVGIGEYWGSQPSHRLQARPALKGGGEILAAVGTCVGPMVLVAREGAGETSSGLLLRVLHKGSWREVVLPSAARALVEREGRLPTNEAKGGRWWLLSATASGVELWSAASGSDSAEVWMIAQADVELERAWTSAVASLMEDEAKIESTSAVSSRERRRLERERRAKETERIEQIQRLEVRWTEAHVQLPEGAGTWEGSPGIFKFDGRDAVVGWRSAAEASLSVRAGEVWQSLWRGAVPKDAGVVAMPGCGRIAFIWATGAYNSAGYGLQFVEVSAHSGRELYVGPGVSISPVSSTDLRFLAIGLLGASAAVLLFVLKSERADKAFHLPEGAALAEGWRRGLATMIDLFVSLAIAAEFQGVDLSEAMSLSGWIGGKGLPVMFLGLGIACVTGAVLEWTFGRSLGKMLAGCEVIDVSMGRITNAEMEEAAAWARPTLFRSVVRNSIKWIFPPVGVFMALDSAGRHPGDVFARTAVVVWVPEEPDDSEM